MQTVIVSDKGQVVIPAEIRRRLGITPGCQLEFSLEGNAIRVEVKRRIQPTRPEDGYGPAGLPATGRATPVRLRCRSGDAGSLVGWARPTILTGVQRKTWAMPTLYPAVGGWIEQHGSGQKGPGLRSASSAPSRLRGLSQAPPDVTPAQLGIPAREILACRGKDCLSFIKLTGVETI